MSLPSLVLTLTSPAVSPSAAVVIMVWAHTGWTDNAKLLPSAVPTIAVRRDRPCSVREIMRSPSISYLPRVESRASLGAAAYGPQSQLGDMIQGKILRALHLHEPRDRALELEGTLALDVEAGRGRGCRADELHFLFVEFVDHGDEAHRLVLAVRPHPGDVGHDHGVEVGGDTDEVGGAHGLGTPVEEMRHGDARRGARDLDIAALGAQHARLAVGAAAQGAKRLVELGVRPGAERRQIDVEVAQPVQAIIVVAAQFHHLEPFLDEIDERDEALALQAVLVEIVGLAV